MTKFGCCLATASFVPQVDKHNVKPDDPLVQLKDGLALLAGHGYDFAELTVGALTGLTEEQFEQAKRIIAESGLPVPVLNSFIPPRIKLTGPQVSMEEIRSYVELAMSRVSAVGARMIIFGSGGARSYPEGFPKDQAMEQIGAFLTLCDEIAEKYGITVAIEPLNRGESNVINTVEEALELALRLRLPRIKVLADSYHMLLEEEKLEMLHAAVKERMLAHVHIADRDRVFPGLPAERGMDFPAFFRTLHEAGYEGLISAECRADGFAENSKTSLDYVRSVWKDIRKP